MNGQRWSRGFTVVEAMIFLAVSGLMFVMLVAFINGRQGRTEFTQSARGFQVELQDIANDVSTGYFPETGKKCTTDVNGNISFAGASVQGYNNSCIFVGKTMLLDASDDGYKLFSLAGRSMIGQQPVESLAESRVAIIEGATIDKSLNGSMKVGCIFYGAAGAITPAADKPCSATSGITTAKAISFMTTFVERVVAADNSRDIRSDIYVKPSADLSASNQIKDLNTGSVKNPPSGVYVCLQSNASNQYGLLQIGGTMSSFTTDMTINQGACS